MPPKIKEIITKPETQYKINSGNEIRNALFLFRNTINKLTCSNLILLYSEKFNCQPISKGNPGDYLKIRSFSVRLKEDS